MKKIPLTRGMFALVDDSDYDFLMEWNWHAHQSDKCWYAANNKGSGGNSQFILMHRLIMQAAKEVRIDHIDRNGLNNQRNNLRFCTQQQNLWNVGRAKNNTSGYKGVSWHANNKCWRARYLVNRKEIHIGGFPTALSAAIAYDEVIKSVRGNFAVTNQSLGLIETENHNQPTNANGHN